jgi:hypothetical protein
LVEFEEDVHVLLLAEGHEDVLEGLRVVDAVDQRVAVDQLERAGLLVDPQRQLERRLFGLAQK